MCGHGVFKTPVLNLTTCFLHWLPGLDNQGAYVESLDLTLMLIYDM